MNYGDDDEVGQSLQTVSATDEDGFRFVLTDDELEESRAPALVSEKHYGRPMDIDLGNCRTRWPHLHCASPSGDREELA